jgi:Tol biopolymer transport system component
MAPEQLEGLDVDARTDIFAIGTLLYEMVTGKKAFQGKSRVLLISAIATSEPPPLSSIEPTASTALDHVVRTCLAKEPADRWQTARDVLAELEWVAEGGAESSGPAPVSASTKRRVWIRRALLATSAVLAGSAVAYGSYYFRGLTLTDEFRFRVPIQLTAEAGVAGGRATVSQAAQGYQGVSGPGVFNPSNFAISPDGRRIAFAARQTVQDTWFLYVRPTDSVTPIRLVGTEGATQPFWSADSSSIAFVTGGRLKRVEASGGPPQDLCEAAGFFGGTWNESGTILFGSAQGLRRIPAEGASKAEPVTRVGENESGHYYPQFLPDGYHFLYTAWSSQVADRAIMVGSLESPDSKTRVLPIGSNAGYADPGYLVFHRDEAVYAQAFDLQSLKVSGEPTRVANEITFDSGSGLGNFSVSLKGPLAYFYSSTNSGGTAGAQVDVSAWQYSWITRLGQIEQSVGPPGSYRGVNVSPVDPKRVAVHRHDANGGDVVIFEPRGADLRLTLNASQHNSMPIWSPDGSQIIFGSLRERKWGLYQTLSTRSGSQEMLYESDLPLAPMSWSPDGKRVVFWLQDPKTSGDVWVLTLDDKKAAPLIATEFNEIHPQISPDGKWIAYTDNSTNNKNEIYVQPFPTGTDRYQVSNDGGDWPRWRGDGKELFFGSIGNPGAPGTSLGATAFQMLLFSSSITVNGPSLEAGPPRQVVIFPVINLPHSGGSYFPYAADPKQERFFVPQFVQANTATTSNQIGPDTFSGLTIALNWASGLKK